VGTSINLGGESLIRLLYSYPNNSRAWKAVIAGKYNGVNPRNRNGHKRRNTPKIPSEMCYWLRCRLFGCDDGFISVTIPWQQSMADPAPPFAELDGGAAVGAMNGRQCHRSNSWIGSQVDVLAIIPESCGPFASAGRR